MCIRDRYECMAGSYITLTTPAMIRAAASDHTAGTPATSSVATLKAADSNRMSARSARIPCLMGPIIPLSRGATHPHFPVPVSYTHLDVYKRQLYPQIHVIANQTNVGFGAANNQGMRAAASSHPRYYFFLNPDTLVRPGAMGHLVKCLDERPKGGMASARLTFGDGHFQHLSLIHI